MGFTMADPALGIAGVRPAVAEGAGERLVLCRGFFQLGKGFLMTGAAEGARRCHGGSNFQGVVGRVTAEAVAYQLFGDMGLMALGTVWNAAVHIVAPRSVILPSADPSLSSSNPLLDFSTEGRADKRQLWKKAQAFWYPMAS